MPQNLAYLTSRGKFGIATEMDLHHLIFNFFFYLCGGTFISLGFLKQTQVGRRYFLYHGVGAGILALCNYLFVGRSYLSWDATLWYLSFTLFCFVFSVTVTQKRRISIAAYFIGSLNVIGALIVNGMDSAPPFQSTGFIFNALLSTLLLGFTLNAMMLGHWYLIQPDLPIAELKRLSLFMLILMVARLVYSVYPLQEILLPKSEMEIYSYLLSTTSGIFLLMRFVWGILAPLVFGYLIWNTVKISSTQSATGILYVAVLSVITGEILSLYLSQFHGISL